MDYIVGKLANALLVRGAITEDEMDVYEYGIDLALYTVGSIGGLILMGVLTGCQVPVTGWILAFATLQALCGGYHARSHTSCFIIMIACGAAMTLLWKVLPGNAYVYIPLALASAGVIMIFAPIEHKHAPMSEAKRNRLQRTDKILAMVLCVLVVILWLLKVPLVYGIVLGMVNSAISISYRVIEDHVKDQRVEK